MSIDPTNTTTSYSSSLHMGIDEASSIAHSLTDRLDKVQTSIIEEFSQALSAKDYYPLAKFSGKVLLIPFAIKKSSLLENVLYVDGARRIDNMINHSFGNATSTAEEVTSGMSKSGIILLNNAANAFHDTVKGSFNEIIDADQLSTNEKVYGGIALTTAGAFLIPYAVKSAKTIFMGAEVALLSYKAYQNKDMILEHPTTQAIIQKSQGLLAEAGNKASSLYDQGLETWSKLPTEHKVAAGAAAVTIAAATGYGAIAIAPAVASTVSSVTTPVVTAGKWALRGLLALKSAEMLFGQSEATKEAKA